MVVAVLGFKFGRAVKWLLYQYGAIVVRFERNDSILRLLLKRRRLKLLLAIRRAKFLFQAASAGSAVLA